MRDIPIEHIRRVLEDFIESELARHCCPACGQPSQLIINPEQAFCTNDDCVLLMFNPSLWGKMYAGGFQRHDLEPLEKS